MILIVGYLITFSWNTLALTLHPTVLVFIYPVTLLSEEMMTEAVVRMCYVKKALLKISLNSQERSLFFKKVAGLRLSCDFCQFFKNTFFNGTPPAAASVMTKDSCKIVVK